MTDINAHAAEISNALMMAAGGCARIDAARHQSELSQEVTARLQAVGSLWMSPLLPRLRDLHASIVQGSDEILAGHEDYLHAAGGTPQNSHLYNGANALLAGYRTARELSYDAEAVVTAVGTIDNLVSQLSTHLAALQNLLSSMAADGAREHGSETHFHLIDASASTVAYGATMQVPVVIPEHLHTGS